MEASFRPVSFPFLAFLFLPNFFFFFFCTGLSELRCIDTERQALLNFKQHLIDSSNRLSSWTAHGDCCQWVGVFCHNLTAHVHQLHLRSLPPVWDGFMDDDQYEAYRRSRFGGKLNPSLLDLKHLNYFDLSYNNFTSIAIPSFLGLMKSLTHLILSNAGFVGLIPHQLGNLSNLHFLNLEGYGLYVNNLEWLLGLPLLQHLDMSYVNLSKPSDWVQLTNTLPSLLDLCLSHCQPRSIPLTSSVNFSSLLTLDLSGNQFENTLILSWIFGLSNLVSLDLSDTYFQGRILVDLQNMTSLSHLDLSWNNFNSSIPNWLYSFSRLEFLNLGYNNLQGTISSAIGNLASAISIDLSGNELEGKLPRSLGNLCNLREIRLSSNKWSQEISEILESLSSHYVLSMFGGKLNPPLLDLKHLNYLDLSFNNFSITHIPKFLGSMKSCVSYGLVTLYLEYAQLFGHLTNELGKFKNLVRLSIWNNTISGVVSKVHFTNLTRLNILFAFGNKLTLKESHNWIPPFQLKELSLQSWNLGPKFPPWPSSQRHLLYLDILSKGVLDVVPPSSWNFSSQYKIPNTPMIFSTSVIDLSSDNFNGPLPLNHLSGKIPNCWMKWKNLAVLNLGNNNFTGNIPASMGSLTNLNSLHLYNNLLSGKFPSSLKNCEELVLIDVAENEFVGKIPSRIGHSCSSLMSLSLCSNNFHGLILENFGKILDYSTILQLVKSIDFFKNSLSGEIPEEVTNFQGLQSLNLLYNLLIRCIPMNIGTMLTFLSHLNLPNNNLTGKILPSTQLQSLTTSSFIGNKLYGLPLTENCTVNGVKPNNENTRSKDTNGLEVDWFYLSMTLGFVLWRIMYFQFLDHTGYKLKSVVSL
ncbi:hypothetical protein ACB094_12G061200 [Castanea mollissima]